MPERHYCVNCQQVGELTLHGRCATCGSDSVVSEHASCLLTQKQAAERLGVSVEWLRHRRYSGEVRAVKLGHRSVRISEAEVARLRRKGSQ
jgi:excisionase family DNA binding protein